MVRTHRMVAKRYLLQNISLILIWTPILLAIPDCLIINNEALCNSTMCKFNNLTINTNPNQITITCKSRSGNGASTKNIIKCSSANSLKIANCYLEDIHGLLGDMKFNKFKKLELINARFYDNFYFLFPVDQLDEIELKNLEKAANVPKDLLREMRNLTYCGISGSSFQLTEDFFAHNSMLKVLKLSGNTFSNSEDVPEGLLKNNVYLETFSWIADSGPKRFPKKFFDKLSKLNTFHYGAKNFGEYFSIDGDLPSSLRELVLQNGNCSAEKIGETVEKLSHLEILELKSLQKFKLTNSLFIQLKRPSLKNFTFSGNKVSCEMCEMLKFEGSKLSCIYGNESYKLPDDRENLLRRFCPSSTSMYLAVILATVFFVIAILVTVLVLNERIRITLYHQRFLAFFFKLEVEDDKKFDAYISYADEDLDLVKRIITTLENGCDKESSKTNRRFKFCIRDRDWDVGVETPRNLTESLARSRLTIILMSKNFINSSSRQEFDIAYGEHKILVIMRVSGDGRECQVTENDLNSERLQSMRLFLKTFKYLREDDKDFWQKLVYRLPHKKMIPLEGGSNNEESIRQSSEFAALMS